MEIETHVGAHMLACASPGKAAAGDGARFLLLQIHFFRPCKTCGHTMEGHRFPSVHLPRVILWWGTTWEGLVLHVFLSLLAVYLVACHLSLLAVYLVQPVTWWWWWWWWWCATPTAGPAVELFAFSASSSTRGACFPILNLLPHRVRAARAMPLGGALVRHHTQRRNRATETSNALPVGV